MWMKRVCIKKKLSKLLAIEVCTHLYNIPSTKSDVENKKNNAPLHPLSHSNNR